MKSIVLVTLIFMVSTSETEALATGKQEQQELQQQIQWEAPAKAKVQEATIRKLNFKTPAQRMLAAQKLRQQQQVQQIQQHQQLQQQQQQQHQQQESTDRLRFQVAKPDLVHSVGLDTVKNEAAKVLAQRKQIQGETQVTLAGKPYQGGGSGGSSGSSSSSKGGDYNYNKGGDRGGDRSSGDRLDFNKDKFAKSLMPNFIRDSERDAKKLLGGFDLLGGGVRRFNSLIVIANSNSNANLGVASLSFDLLKSFLSQFYVGKTIDNVLKDDSLADYISKFNLQYTKSSSSGKSYESTSQLSANIPSYSNEKAAPKDNVANSHSESTVVLQKDANGAAESTKNLGFGMPVPTVVPTVPVSPYQPYYSYVPYQDGGVIVINNVNDNVNDRVKSVLSGEGVNVGDYNTGLVLPLSKVEIDRLMEDAIIINNDNRNKNNY